MKALVGFALVAVLFASCAEPGAAPAPGENPPETVHVPGDPLPGEATELAAARSRWEANSLSDYHYVFEDDCGECQPFSGQVVVWDGELLDPSRRSLAVEEIFDILERAAAAGQSVEAVFDQETGYPTDVWIDRESRAFDGGIHWVIGGLMEGLPGDAASLAGLEAAWARWTAARPPAYEYTMAIVCDCPLDGSLWVQVVGDEIVDWRVDTDGEVSGGSISPITVDTMFSDLAQMMASDGGVVETGIRFEGSAQYDPELGYPVWVGLDIEVLDPESALSELPPRMVNVVTDFHEIDPPSEGETDDLAGALERWSAAGLVDYQYELTIHDIIEASFSPPYTVAVLDGQVASVSLDGRILDDLDFQVSSVDELFVRIQQWIDAGSDVEALFHAELGYPVLVTVRAPDSEVPLVFSLGDLIPR